MAAPKIMNGARAKLGIYDPASGKTRIIGLFSNVSYGLRYAAEPAYILGKFAPAEIDYTSQEPVSITCTGWRVIEHGPHAEAGVPRLQDLLTHEYLEMVVMDRQREATGKDGRIAKFHNVRPTGFSTTINARGLEEITVEFIAILVDDESTTNNEHPSATQLP